MSLKAENISKSYNGKKVLDNVTIEVNEGEIVGLLGPNGAGKTTSFYIITGVIKPCSGKVYLDGIDITNLPMYKRARKGIGYLSQEPALFQRLTVEENLLIAIESVISNKNEREEKLNSLIDKFGLANIRKRVVSTLSGGEKRKTEIARTFVKNPKFILLDEPFLGIDPLTVQYIQKLIFLLKKENIGIIVTDHNIYETLPIVDRAYIIYEGKIFTEGNASSLIENKAVREIYLGERIMKFREERGENT